MTLHESQEQSIAIDVIREPAFTPITPRKRQVCAEFGIPPREVPLRLADQIQLPLRPGTITLLFGPSGSGKSSILRAIKDHSPSAHSVDQANFSSTKSIVDLVAPRGSLQRTLQILTACGLTEPRLWVRAFSDLSAGQQFRARLARAVGAALATRRSTLVICDEFTSGLHRRAAKAIAHNLRKLITRTRLILCVASSHDDILEDLQPDQLIRLGGPSPQVEQLVPDERPVSLSSHAHIEPGTLRDYQAFAPMHYRHRDALGFVDKIFLLRDKASQDALAVAVFAHGAMELAMRNIATDNRFRGNLHRLNRELRILRRLVLHPDVRGCGLGHWFVSKTLPMVGVRFVECLAAMGSLNPIFERAGMSPMGRSPLPRGRRKILERLRDLKLDPFEDELENQIARNPRVRKFVEQTIADWSCRAHSGRSFKIAPRTPRELGAIFRQLIGQPPMYYLWDREREFPRAGGTEGGTEGA